MRNAIEQLSQWANFIGKEKFSMGVLGRYHFWVRVSSKLDIEIIDKELIPQYNVLRERKRCFGFRLLQ